MTITRHNCEAAFLDYYEKTLSPVEVAEVLFFLEENPDLKAVFESYQDIFLGEDKIKFPNKEALKKISNSEELEAALASEINKSNCERFFVASAEGVLSESQNQKLQLFLAKHPQLKGDYELFKKCKLTVEPISFDNKELLKKGAVNAFNREAFFIRAIEKDLNALEEKQLSEFLLTNPSFEREYRLFKHTVLTPEKINFEFKSELKRNERKPILVSIFSQRTTYYAAAAAVLLLAGLFFFFRSDDTQATFLANNNGLKLQKTVTVKAEEIRKPVIEVNENSVSKRAAESSFKNSNPASSVVSNRIKPKAIIEETIADSSSSEKKIDESFIAKKAEEKKMEQPIQEDILITKKEETKVDSTAMPAVQNEIMAVAPATSQYKEEYQTVASIVNKKVRSILGIKKATECEDSDKIGLWDLAMVAKRSVQKIIGTKTLDVNKVCEGSGGKVEYVFAAGNFEISKTAFR